MSATSIEQKELLIEIRKKHLEDTDWVNSKWMDIEIKAVTEGKTPEEIEEMKKEYRELYQTIYEDREVTRAQIDALQAEVDALKAAKH